MITFRNKHGPTKLKQVWTEFFERIFTVTKCINWWSSSGSIGLLECEDENGKMILGQWALADEMKLMGIFEVSDEEIVNIRDGFDAGNVSSPAMRAIRIGETGDQD